MKDYSYKIMLLIITFSTIYIKAQGDLQYNSLINSAENFILKDDYKSALQNYNNVKADFNYIYGKDIYNALICANKEKNWEQTCFWSKLFLAKGVNKTFFNQKKFREFKKTKFWKKILKSNISDNVNVELKKKVDSLVNIDQGEFVLLKEKNIPNIYDLTANIDKILLELDKKYDGITEDKIGLNIINDTVFSFLPTYSVLLRHSYQSKKENSYFNYKKNKNAMEKDLFFSIIDYKLMPIFIYKNETFFLKEDFLSEDYKKELLQYLEKAKKIKSQNVSDFALFYPSAKVSSFASAQSEEQFNKILNNFYYK
ncbi:hypothetical protein ACN9MN_14735 [Chryseobacterium sp. S-02]|uniref:hypothetical protein n=1 Tax=Chryseobacterium sp. S-02 TaxID=3404064 RepID=UPI003CF00C5B